MISTNAFRRIILQAERALTQEPIRGVLPGLHGLTLEEIRMANIYSIALVALREKR